MSPKGSGTQTANGAFGGPDAKTLYITEAAQNVIYRVKMDIPRLKRFGDKP